MSTIKVVLDGGAIMPTRAHRTDAGLDLYAREGQTVPAGGSAVFDTGVHIEIPEGCVGLLTSKSGLMRKSGITERNGWIWEYGPMIQIKEFNGNLFNSKADVLCHQVNTYGVMGAGIAAEVKKRFPSVYTAYRELCKTFNAESLHGEALILLADNRKGQYIANLFGQTEWGTNYKSLEAALRKVAAWMDENGKKTVAMPYKMSCGLAGGNWDVVRGIISSVFDGTGINVEIWKLE